MKTRYSTYQEIDRELEILKIQREIHIQKMLRSTKGIKHALAPSNIVKTSFANIGQLGSLFGRGKGLKTILISALIRFAINRFLKNKRA